MQYVQVFIMNDLHVLTYKLVETATEFYGKRAQLLFLFCFFNEFLLCRQLAMCYV